jgi:hypothetical protein
LLDEDKELKVLKLNNNEFLMTYNDIDLDETSYKFKKIVY